MLKKKLKNAWKIIGILIKFKPKSLIKNGSITPIVGADEGPIAANFIRGEIILFWHWLRLFSLFRLQLWPFSASTLNKLYFKYFSFL